MALLLICFLWALNSLRADLLPRFSSGNAVHLGLQAVVLAVFAAVAGGVAVARRTRLPSGRQIGALALVGLGLFVVPTVMIYLAREWVSDSTRVAVFSLTPVFAVVLEPHIGRGADSPHRGGLIAALVAVLGTLCVFPLDLPQSVQAGAAFCGVVLAVAFVAAANCLGVLIATDLPDESLTGFAALISGFSAVGLALASLFVSYPDWSLGEMLPELGWSMGTGVPALALLFWLMPRISATRMTTRFVLAPLIANLFALLFLRPVVGFRAGLGLVLIAFGAGWLLFAQGAEPQNADSNLQLGL